jgi:hypothetical protein
MKGEKAGRVQGSGFRFGVRRLDAAFPRRGLTRRLILASSSFGFPKRRQAAALQTASLPFAYFASSREITSGVLPRTLNPEP